MIELKNVLRTSNLNKILTAVKNYVDRSVSDLASTVSDVMEDVDSSITSLENGKEDKIKNAVAKATIVDNDTIPISDSAASSATKKITFTVLKTVLKAYFDTLYNKYTHPKVTSSYTAGFYKVTVDEYGHVTAATAVAKADITALGIPGSDTTYGVVSTSANGLAPKLPGGTVKFLRADGTWATPPDTNTTYTNESLGNGYGTCATAAATTAKAVTLSNYALVKNGVVSVKFTYDVPAGATLNINSKGAKAIYYKGKAVVAGVICAGEVATFMYDGTYYHVLTVDRNRFFGSLVPYGTAITASATATKDLNTTEFMKVGNYYCSANAQAKYITNLPKANTAFMMQVYSPLSQTVDNESGTWVYRLRKLTAYTGEEYVQYCYTNGTGGNWTYGPWQRVVTENMLGSYATKTYVDTAIANLSALATSEII